MSSQIPGNTALTLWGSSGPGEGDRSLLVSRDGSWGYHWIRQRAAGVASVLTGQGVRPGDRVALFLERGPDAVSAYYGVLAAGAAVVVVNETLRPRQVEYILEHSGARTLIASEALMGRQPREIQGGIPRLLAREFPTGERMDPVRRTGDDLAQIIYTSGSTGLPKGVALSHANLQAGIASVTEYLGLESSDRIASLLPFSFDYGLNQLLSAVAVGGTLIVERSPLPQQIVRTLRDLEVTVLPAVPPLWHQILAVSDFEERPIPSIRTMTNTGGHLSRDVVARLRTAQPQARLFPMYGLTEAFRSTYLDPGEVERRPGSIGKAIPGAEILVLREDLTPCEPGEVGELVHRGPTVALGYWKDPEATQSRFRPNPVRPEGTPDSERVVFSGDLVRRDEEGFLYFVGRRDRMIKTLGFRVSPDEVADVLHASGQVADVVVGSEPDAARGSLIVAYVVLKAGGTLAALETFARNELPRYMQPGRYEVRSALPRTDSGKHDVKATQKKAPVD